MKNPLFAGARRVRAATVCALALSFLLPLSTVAQAQERADRGTFALPVAGLFSPVAPLAAGQIGRSLANLDYRVLAAADPRSTPEAQRGYRGRRGRGGDRAVMGLVLGAIGGLLVGGLVGAELTSEQSCHCSDPELHGFAIGAPIGAFVGGFLGYAVAR
jgi:hypothetical protein